MPTDREMLREKLEQIMYDSTRVGEKSASEAVVAYLEAEYEPLRKREPRYHVSAFGRWFDVVHESTQVVAKFADNLPNAEAEALAFRDKLNAADRKEK